jgi:SAM-dependent methyltransferase
MTTRAAETLFDRSREYDDELNRGLRMSGEDKHYYLHGRVRHLVAELGAGPPPRRILDFGCGFGDASQHLAATFPDAEVVGIDTAEKAIEHARATHGSDRVRFEPLRGFDARERFDLCYVNGVFHHIPPADRVGAVEMVWKALVPGGRFALFENNPWNPGTRLLMRRLEFDRDAIPISPPEAQRLLRRGGFARCAPPQFLFWFPRPAAILRFAEPWLVRVPFGAQYLVLGTAVRDV